MIVGIDIGGTTIKLGVVDEKGNILTASKFPTEEWTNPAEKLTELIQKECARFQKEYSIEGVGIGVPGQISADKESILELTNIPSLNGFALRSDNTINFGNSLIFTGTISNNATLEVNGNSIFISC